MTNWFELPNPLARRRECLIPPAVLLGCRGCGWAWVQDLSWALANPTAEVRCPACGEHLRRPEGAGAASDTPTVVDVGANHGD
jgi:ribosomal protein S27E